jgi:hypothetical protein
MPELTDRAQAPLLLLHFWKGLFRDININTLRHQAGIQAGNLQVGSSLRKPILAASQVESHGHCLHILHNAAEENGEA